MPAVLKFCEWQIAKKIFSLQKAREILLQISSSFAFTIISKVKKKKKVKFIIKEFEIHISILSEKLKSGLDYEAKAYQP